MTVKELREKLAKFADQTHVALYMEDGNQQVFFGIDDLSLSKGEPLRDENGKPGFRFDGKGTAEWLLISISRDE